MEQLFNKKSGLKVSLKEAKYVYKLKKSLFALKKELARKCEKENSSALPRDLD